MKWYYEIAIGSPTKRGSLFPLDDMPEIINQYAYSNPVYRSVYLYPEHALDIATEDNSVKNYFGERWAEYIPIDIDKGKDEDIEVMKRTMEIIMKLETQYKLDATQYNLYFSGTGFHIDLPIALFNIKPSSDMPYIIKATMGNILGQDIDPSVYSRTALYRMNYSLNTKSGLYKVPITIDDLGTMDMEFIRSLAKTRPQELGFTEYEDYMGASNGNGELAKYLCKHVPDIKSFTKVLEPSNIASCIHALYQSGPQRGTRNLASMRIASHFKRSGIPSSATKAALLEWNHKSLKEDLIIEHVENVYNRNYRYGCDDPILKRVCNTRCVYYKNKDYTVKLYSAHDMQMMAEERETTDYTGRTIDLASLFGQYEKDCIIYPGELVTVMGPTGSGKTALVQHIVLGIDMLTGDIKPNAQLDTVWLSLELSPQLMHRRNLQIVSRLPKSKVISNLKQVFKDNEQHISHIKIRVNSGSIKDIEELIRTLDPKLLVIDYLDLVESGKTSEHEQLKNICHGLSSLAVRYDKIIIAIAQVRRDNAREKHMDLYAGKGSGAIENASRKVIAINGQAHDPKKHVMLLKNTDGELFDTSLLHDGKTLRFSVDEEYYGD